MKGLVTGLVLLTQVVAAPTHASSDVSRLLSALELGGYTPGERPPDFVGRTADGKPLSLTDLRGNVVLLTFWASWCPPCRPDMVLLEDLHRTLGSQRLVVIAVNVRERPTVVRDYAAALGLTFAILVDPRGAIQASYGVIGLPTTFLIARDGRAVARAIGPRDWGGAPSRELIQLLLHEPAPPSSSTGARMP
jgi:peroxiredoxin